MSNKQKLFVVIGLVISAVFLWLAFRNLDPLSVLQAMGNANLLWIAVSVLIFLASVYVIAWRWQFLINPIKPVSFNALNELVWIGYMGNNVYPFRAGEALRAYLLQSNHGIPFVKGVTTILVERIFDGLVLVLFVLVSLAQTDIVNPDLRRLVDVALPLFIVATLIFLGLALMPNILRRFIALVAGILPQKIGELVIKLGEDFISGLSGLRSPLPLLGMSFASVLTWGLQGLCYWAVAKAFGVETTYFVMLLAVGAANLAGLIPASPGQIGVFEFFASSVLIASGTADESLALTIALTHIVVWLPMTLAGFVLLARRGLGWSDLTRVRERLPHEAGLPDEAV
jgi:uncharacterized protein (TIRG00374 family)